MSAALNEEPGKATGGNSLYRGSLADIITEKYKEVIEKIKTTKMIEMIEEEHREGKGKGKDLNRPE